MSINLDNNFVNVKLIKIIRMFSLYYNSTLIKLILILLIFTPTKTYSQFVFKSDEIKNSYHSEIENQILNNLTEFQFRVWIKENSQQDKDEGLLLLSYINQEWKCEVFIYKYVNEVRQLIKVHEQNDSSDSLLHYLKHDKIIDLPDMETFENKLCFYDEYGTEVHIGFVFGPRYIFEFVTKEAFKRIEYHNPTLYFNTYPSCSELEKINNIINFIHRSFSMLPLY